MFEKWIIHFNLFSSPVLRNTGYRTGRVEVATSRIGARGILVEMGGGCQELARGRIKAVFVIRARDRMNTVIVSVIVNTCSWP
jgi:hypothetical protein